MMITCDVTVNRAMLSLTGRLGNAVLMAREGSVFGKQLVIS